jgi:hypothetical protein
MCSINFFYFNYLIKNKKKNQNKSNIKNKKNIFFTRNSRLEIKKKQFQARQWAKHAQGLKKTKHMSLGRAACMGQIYLFSFNSVILL